MLWYIFLTLEAIFALIGLTYVGYALYLLALGYINDKFNFF